MRSFRDKNLNEMMEEMGQPENIWGESNFSVSRFRNDKDKYPSSGWLCQMNDMHGRGKTALDAVRGVYLRWILVKTPK
jgi:hypothetical protein